MVLLPLFVEVILTFALLFWSGALHSRDLRAGTVKPEDIARTLAFLCSEQNQVTSGAVVPVYGRA